MARTRRPSGWPRLVLRVEPRVKAGQDGWGVILCVALGSKPAMLAGVSDDAATAREAEQVAAGLWRVWAALGGRAQLIRRGRSGRILWERTYPDTTPRRRG